MKTSKSHNKAEVLTTKTLEDQLTQKQKETWCNIKQGFVELKMVDECKLKTRPVKELLNEL